MSRCAEALTQELRELARELLVPDSKFNKLITRS